MLTVVAIQRHHVRRGAAALAPLAADDQLLVCHGNGPRIGLLAMESQDDPAVSKAYPLDALGAQTQGMIGYWLTQELRNAGVSRPVVAVATQTVVDEADPAFSSPTKFIGRVYPRSKAERLVEAAVDKDYTSARIALDLAVDPPTATARPSAIGALTDAAAILRGDAGTTVTATSHNPDDNAPRQATGTDSAPSTNREGIQP